MLLRKSRPLLYLFCAILAVACQSGPDRWEASHDGIEIMGRHEVDSTGAVAFGASGVSFFIRFEGNYLDVELEDEFRYGSDYNWFTAVIDGQEPVRFRTEPGRMLYRVADSLGSGVHTAVLSKATEGQNGRNRLLSVHAERLLEADPLPSRRLEFIGDSITCGFGNDDSQVPCATGKWFDQHQAWLSYGALLGRHFDAQWMLSSVSGIGMHRNWNTPGPTLPTVYDGIYMEGADSTTSWDFTAYQPDLVLVALGTNDFSDGDGETPRPPPDSAVFVSTYSDFVARLRENYPQATFLLSSSAMLSKDRDSVLVGYLNQVAAHRAAEGDSSVYVFAYQGRYIGGCSAHPSVEEHRRMADEMAPTIARIMQW